MDPRRGVVVISGCARPGQKPRNYMPRTRSQGQKAGRSTSRGRQQTDEMNEWADEEGGGMGGGPRRATTLRAGTSRQTSVRASRGQRRPSRRGFAAMSSELQKSIARKGGRAVSRNRRHMAEIG